MIGISNQSILIISPEAWGINHVSKHHFASVISKKGNIVYFLNPPSKEQSKIEIYPNLFVINYQAIIRGSNYLFIGIRNLFAKKEIQAIRRIADIKSWDIVWSFDPFRFQNLALFRARCKIFHSVDVHNSHLANTTARNADIVLAPSQLIVNKYKEDNSNCHVINHGLSEHFLNYPYSKPPKNDPINIASVGNLNYPYLDANILREIISQNPGVIFHLIGPSGSSNLGPSGRNIDLIDFLKNQENCILYGSVKPELLPSHFDKMDGFLITYQGDLFKEELSNSHKVLEFLSTGRVIISHYIDEFKDKPDMLEMVTTNKELPKKFKDVISNLDSYNRNNLVEKRKLWSRKNSYSKQIDRIEKLIDKIEH